MPARLVSLDGHPNIPLNSALTVIGRDGGCHVRIDSLKVSRRHCCLALERGALVVCDLGSTNGIAINDARVEAGVVRPGEILAIAHLRYRFEVDAGADPSATSAEHPRGAFDAFTTWTAEFPADELPET